MVRAAAAEIEAVVHRLTEGKPPREARIAVFDFVRDIPYDYPASRDPAEVLAAGRGSCSGKHALLAQMLSAMGYRTKLMYARYDMSELSVEWPPELQRTFLEERVIDIHNFVRADIGSRWVTLDVTWDAALAPYRFPVNLDWDGESDTAIAAGRCEPFEADQTRLQAEKEALLRELPPEAHARRRQALRALAAWLRRLRGEA